MFPRGLGGIVFRMAVVALVDLLKTGSRAWNGWRKSNPQAAADLDGADLRGLDLGSADLSGASLVEADLFQANLANGSFAGANLAGASLIEANLSDANLEKAEASFANFRYANLARANLCLANLEGAELRGASMQATELGYTNLIDVNLSEAKNLETCHFHAPVAIDFRSLTRSPQLPVPFLRGCGLPEELIENLPALFAKPIHNYSLFIESASEDAAFVERLCADLQARGIRCWMASRGAAAGTTGSRFDQARDRHFRSSEVSLLLVLSRHSAQAAWIERDANLWIRHERLHNRKLLYVIRLDDAPLRLSETAVESQLMHGAIDFHGWRERKPYEQALSRLAALLSR